MNLSKIKDYGLEIYIKITKKTYNKKQKKREKSSYQTQLNILVQDLFLNLMT